MKLTHSCRRKKMIFFFISFFLFYLEKQRREIAGIFLPLLFKFFYASKLTEGDVMHHSNVIVFSIFYLAKQRRLSTC